MRIAVVSMKSVEKPAIRRIQTELITHFRLPSSSSATTKHIAIIGTILQQRHIRILTYYCLAARRTVEYLQRGQSRDIPKVWIGLLNSSINVFYFLIHLFLCLSVCLSVYLSLHKVYNLK